MRFALPTRLLRGAALALSLAVAATTLTPTFAMTPAQAQTQSQMDIVDTAVAAGKFNTLAKALEVGGLVDTLKGPGPFTVFAPTDEAFAKVPAADLNQTLQNVDLLRSVLTYHVTAGSMSWADLQAKQQLPTVQGGLVYFDAMSGPKVNGVNVVTSDIKASNGTIHVIDVVLTPPGAGVMNGMAPAPAMAPQAQTQMDIVDTAVAAGQFTTLAKALEIGGLVETLKGPGPFTVFAPTDAAFAKVPAADFNQTVQNVDLLRSVLTYHVTAGSMSWADLAAEKQVPTVQGGLVYFDGMSGPKVNGVDVVISDIKASNGTIHVIDVVLTPPGAGVMNGMAPAPGM